MLYGKITDCDCNELSLTNLVWFEHFFYSYLEKNTKWINSIKKLIVTFIQSVMLLTNKITHNPKLFFKNMNFNRWFILPLQQKTNKPEISPLIGHHFNEEPALTRGLHQPIQCK